MSGVRVNEEAMMAWLPYLFPKGVPTVQLAGRTWAATPCAKRPRLQMPYSATAIETGVAILELHPTASRAHLLTIQHVSNLAGQGIQGVWLLEKGELFLHNPVVQHCILRVRRQK